MVGRSGAVGAESVWRVELCEAARGVELAVQRTIEPLCGECLATPRR